MKGEAHPHSCYDRQCTITDARNGTTTLLYNNLGRATSITQPDGSVVLNEYYPNGQFRLTRGGKNYPVGYAYDAQGRMRFMTNWQSYGSASAKAVTRWNYSPYRGWLVSKDYADKTTGNLSSSEGTSGPVYEYTSAGRHGCSPGQAERRQGLQTQDDFLSFFLFWSGAPEARQTRKGRKRGWVGWRFTPGGGLGGLARGYNIGVGRAVVRSPSLRTGQADFRHPALRSVSCPLGLKPSSLRVLQTEQPLLCKPCYRVFGSLFAFDHSWPLVAAP